MPCTQQRKERRQQQLDLLCRHVLPVVLLIWHLALQGLLFLA
jgi:hypothetical protein